jgi:thiol-disulfide isomerase/thioredoxin
MKMQRTRHWPLSIGRSAGLVAAALSLGVMVCSGCSQSESKAVEKPQFTQSSGGPVASSEQIPASTAQARSANGGPSANPARKILETMVATYQKATSYTDNGTLRLQAQVDNDKIDEPVPFAVTMVRPDKLFVEVYQALAICDGKQMRALIKDLRDQVLIKDVASPLTMKGFYSDRVLNMVLSQGVAGDPPQVMLLLDENSAASLARQGKEPTLLEPAQIDGRDYDRVKLNRRDGVAVFWIDRQTHVLRRLEYPVDDLRRDLASRGHVDHVVLTADFVGAQVNVPVDAKKFMFEVPAGTEQVKFFVQPHPAQLLSKKVPDFKLEGLDKKPISPADLVGKVVVVDFWATWCAPCKMSLPNVQKVYQKYKDNDRVAFLAVSVDQTDVKKEVLLDAMKEMAVTLPICRDTTGVLATVFKTPDIPAMFIIGPDGIVQDYQRGYDENLASALPQKLDQVLSGKSIYEKGLREYQDELKKLDQAPVMPTDDPKAADTQVREIPKVEIAQRSDPKTFRLTSLWTCTSLKSPGNILVVSPPGKPQQILVVDNWKSVAELGPDGHVVATHELAIPDKEAVGLLRTGVGADGKRYYAGSANGQQQVHVFDERWKLLFNFPPDALENNHPGIADMQFGDLEGDGKLKLYLGYWGSVGAQAISLDEKLEGKRLLWSNRMMEMVLRLAVSASDGKGPRQVLCVNGRGTLVALDSKGDRKSEIAVGNRPILWVVAADLEGSGAMRYCGLTSTDMFPDIAIGFTLEGKELWRYKLPKGVHQQMIEPVVVGRVTHSGPGQWLLPAADGSIHIISADGKLLDRFNYGATLSGLATTQINGRPVVLISSFKGTEPRLEALQIE